MDIWKWIGELTETLEDEGHDYLAEIITDLPHYCLEDEHEKVDALIPTALHLARQQKNKWLEIYIRHWYQQNRILHREEVRSMLEGAVQLLEFAHQDDTKDCPQSICIVQDLAGCYSLIDGPGYAQERLTVSQETLERIDPAWPCFVCINSEYINALLDQEKPQEALAKIKSVRESILKTTGKLDKGDFVFLETRALNELKRFEDSEKIIKKATSNKGGEGYERDKRGLHSYTLALQGKTREAGRRMLSYPEASISSRYFSDWCKTSHLIALKDPSKNTWELHVQFEAMLQSLAKNGVIRFAVNLRFLQADLALKRGRPRSAARILDKIKILQQELKADHGVAAQISSLEEHINEMGYTLQIPPSGSSLEDYLKSLPEDPEERFNILELRTKEEPQNETLLLAFYDVLTILKEEEQAQNIMKSFLTQCPDSPQSITRYGFALLQAGNINELEQFISEWEQKDVSEPARISLNRVLANLSRKLDKPDEAKSHTYNLLEKNPDDVNLLFDAANLEMETGQFDKALSNWTRVIELSNEKGKTDKESLLNYHRERIICSSITDNEALTQESAQALSLKDVYNEDDAPEVIRVQFLDEDGDPLNYLAHRIGPAKARVQEIGEYESVQHFKDLVVFNTRPLNTLKQEFDDDPPVDSEGYDTFIYKVCSILEHEKHDVFVIEGVFPGVEAWEELEESLRDEGAYLKIQSDNEYFLYLRDEDQEIPGVYAYLVVPEWSEIEKIAALLKDITRKHEAALVWLELLEKMGDKLELHKQGNLIKKYGLELDD